MRLLLGLVLLAFLSAVGVFAVQNTQPITVRFLNQAVTAPVAILSIACYLLGMVSGWNVVAFLRRSIRSVSEEPRRD